MMSLSPFLMSSSAQGPSEELGTVIDSGWVQLDLTDSNGDGLSTADFHQLIPYGVQMADISLEIQVDGSNGYHLENPRIWSPSSGSMLLDWSNGPGLGQLLDFKNGDPHNGRMTPKSDSTATWQLPENSTVTDIILEALRPVDPLVSLAPYILDIQASAVHPSDGRLYLAVSGDSLLMLDASASPVIIDRIEDVDIHSLVVDYSTNRLLGLESDGSILCWSIVTGTICDAPSNLASPTSHLAMDPFGILWAAGPGHLHSNDGTGWQEVASSSSLQDWPDEIVTDIHFLGSEVLISTNGGGIARWNSVSNSLLGIWSTANHLPSDHISVLEEKYGTLFVGTFDEGLARKDLNSGNWLAVWHDDNWLSSNNIVDLSTHGDSISILTNVGLHVYDVIQSSFTGNSMMSAMGLNQDGMDLISWPTGGLRAPLESALMVSDGSGKLAVLNASAVPQALGDLLLATTPTNFEVYNVLELNGVLYAAGDVCIDRFNVHTRSWMEPLFPENGVISMTTDGSRLFSVGDELSIDVWASNGSKIETITLGMSANPTSLAWDSLTGSLLVAMGEDGLGRLEMSSGSIDVWNENDDFEDGFAFDVVARNGIAFVPIEGEGVARVDLVSGDVLGTWKSSDVDDVEHAPIAVGEDHVYLGLYDAGVFVFDRDTGEIVETWSDSDEEWWWWVEEDQSTFSDLPNSWVISLHVDSDDEVYIGHEMGFVRHTDDGFDSPNGDDMWFGGKTTAFASESNRLYALQEYQGLCIYQRDDLSLIECWNNNPRATVQIDVTDGNSLTIPSPNRLYVSTDHGAYLIDTLNETILQSWSSGGSTWNTPVIVWNDIAHLGVDGIGVARYDLNSQIWLPPWDASSGQIPDNGVTALSDDLNNAHLWVGGDFGLVEIDMNSANQIQSWDHSSDPQVSPHAPQQLVRIGDVLHYLETPPERRDIPIFGEDDIGFGILSIDEGSDTSGRQRPGGGGNGFGQPTTRVYRYDIDDAERLSSLRPSYLTSGNQNGLSIIGMENVRDDELWIGVGKPTSYHWSNDPAGIARWDAGAGEWLDDIDPDSSVEDDGLVALLGDCDETSIQEDSESCLVFTSYGPDHHRMMWLDGTIEAEPLIEGPIRSGVTWDGHGLLATPNGVVRLSTSNWAFADTWEAGDGLPPSASNNVRALEVVGEDLWMITKSSSSSSSSQIHRLNGSTNQWMTWSGSSTDEIVDGTGITIEMCGDIIHFGFYGEIWNGEGGISRFNPVEDEWLEPFESEWGDVFDDGGRQFEDSIDGLMWSSVSALACDSQDILYIGVDDFGDGIQRYDSTEDEWLYPIYSDEYDLGFSSVAYDAMHWTDSILAIGHLQDGGMEGAFSLIPVLGDWVGNGRSVDYGFSSTSIVPYPQIVGTSADWIVAQPGANGHGRTKIFNSLGDDFGTLDTWTGMTDGRARHFAGNNSHVYGAFLSSNSDRTDGSTMILEGVQVGEGDIEWLRSWELSYAGIERLLLDGGILWITTRYSGLHRIDLATGNMNAMPPTAHDSLSFMVPYDGDIVIGLSAVEMSAGVAVFDLDNSQFVGGALIPGLPSPQVKDIVENDGHIWFATPGGVGSWNIASGTWGPTISVGNGLTSSEIRGLEVVSSELWVSTFGGLCVVDTSSTPNVQQCLTRNQGLAGTSSVDITSDGGLIYTSHDGFGSTRPGATQVRGVDRNALIQYHADSLPSNDVTAIAADGWGVHIATQAEPLSHWNAATNQMENGIVSSDTGDWPITSLSSNGQILLAGTAGILHRISVQGVGHPLLNSTGAPGIVSTIQGQYGTWVASGESGVRPFGAHSGYQILSQIIDKRATPLRASLGVEMTDITTEARPGNSFSLDLGTGVLIGGNNSALILSETPLIFSSDVEGAAVWARTNILNYSGIWDLSATDEGMRSILQTVAFGATNESGHDLHLRFDSPSEGSILVRLTYTAIPSDSPVQLLLLEDRPNDGGDALIATWTPTLEAGFTQYNVYATQGDVSSWPPSASELALITPDLIIPERFNVQGLLTTAEGFNFTTNVDTYVVVAVQYSNGNISNASGTLGPVRPFDDIPMAPTWASTEIDESSVKVEWEYCTALDYMFSQFDYSTSPLAPLESWQGGWQGEEVNPALGDNFTSVPLLGLPVWARIYCVDDTWQIDIENPLLIGPFTTSIENDTDAPAPLDWVLVDDHPDDAGSALDISWAESEADDCALYAVHLTPVNGALPPLSTNQIPIVKWISGCENTETMISGLENGQPYWVTVVAYDHQLNAGSENNPWDEGIPLADLRETEAPGRIDSIYAIDAPNDSGNSIEISWVQSSDIDVAYYTIWISEHDVSDVSDMWPRCSFYLDTCAEMILDVELSSGINQSTVIRKGLYGNGLGNSIRVEIIPDIELFVSISVHDEDGNVHLNDLVTTKVTPVDNLRDLEPPSRMDRPLLSDVVGDYGNALWMEFTPSVATDLAWYEIYVEPFEYEDVCNLQPTLLLPVDSEQPLKLIRFSSGRFLQSGEVATVTIVAVDASANANCEDILTASMAPIADAEPVDVNPSVDELSAIWIENGTALEITWERTQDSRPGLSIYISDSRFAVTGQSELVATNVQRDVFVIRIVDDEPIDSTKYWWVAVTNDHAVGQIVQVSPTEVAPFGMDNEANDVTLIDNLGLIVALISIFILLSALAVVVVMRRSRGLGNEFLDQSNLVSGEIDMTNDMWKSAETESMQTPSESDSLPSMISPEGADTSFIDDLL